MLRQSTKLLTVLTDPFCENLKACLINKLKIMLTHRRLLGRVDGIIEIRPSSYSQRSHKKCMKSNIGKVDVAKIGNGSFRS